MASRICRADSHRHCVTSLLKVEESQTQMKEFVRAEAETLVPSLLLIDKLRPISDAAYSMDGSYIPVHSRAKIYELLHGHANAMFIEPQWFREPLSRKRSRHPLRTSKA